MDNKTWPVRENGYRPRHFRCRHDNISILWSHDIEAVDYTGHPRRIVQLVLREVFPDQNGVTRWGSDVL
ncbi:hypothetical protein [Desulfofundulus salinus]|uniref:hypothetical protein n=1 Tax=Desulfofundulus salinus TaxID=2419843 RepID=UPI0014026D3B|nr:hypothetical protein [Desulfofundulus salinum]